MKSYNTKVLEGLFRKKSLSEEQIKKSWKAIEKAILSVDLKKPKKNKGAQGNNK